MRHQVLGLFERRGLLSSEAVGVKQGWGHRGGFSVHAASGWQRRIVDDRDRRGCPANSRGQADLARFYDKATLKQGDSRDNLKEQELQHVDESRKLISASPRQSSLRYLDGRTSPRGNARPLPPPTEQLTTPAHYGGQSPYAPTKVDRRRRACLDDRRQPPSHRPGQPA